MEQYQRDFLLNRIISKRKKVKVDGKVYYISTIKPEDTVDVRVPVKPPSVTCSAFTVIVDI